MHVVPPKSQPLAVLGVQLATPCLPTLHSRTATLAHGTLAPRVETQLVAGRVP
jgi:hypothetical protein